jgi:hypothetical protein
VKISANYLLCQCISSLYLPSLHGLSRSGVSLLCILLSHERLGFGLGIWHWAFTHEGNTLIDLLIISHGMNYPKNLGATTNNNYILSLRGGLSNRRLFVRRPTNEKRSKKVTCTRSAFLINSTIHKISI